MQGGEQLAQRFGQEPIANLVKARAQLVDHVLICGWHGIMTDAMTDLALVAVGGYGRGELHPCSDIDVMLLLPKGRKEKWRDRLEQFVAFLWDIGLDVGHSVRTISDCISEARSDVTVTTNLMETRLLDGSETLFKKMQQATAPEKIWPPKAFFAAKLEEQKARHARYSDTGYNVEPNVKGSPGGLRDIQMVGWVTARQFGNDNLYQLQEHGFLTGTELNDLVEGRDFLWKIRFALHLLTKRREDRLLFDHQVTIAKMFGYKDTEGSLAVEQLMQRYYRTVMNLLRLNEMLLQLYQELLLFDQKTKTINQRFHARNGFLTANHDTVFSDDPSALLEMFLLIQQNFETVTGVSAQTLRLVEASLDRINHEFRNNPRNQDLFLQIIRASAGVTHELRRMNRYGILGRYIPAFADIVGRMQYDLFHVYTVDAHTLFVVSNLRRFALSRFDHEFPRCSEIMQSLPKPELAYLGGIFHDIAKGRGGDHSVLGIKDAKEFCELHRMSEYDTHLVSWLVEHHLLLSLTAQKKDISDPDTVHEFAGIVGDAVRLDYLYVLTVADVRGTNPKLWNSWKSSLFEELYLQTQHVLARGLENPINREELVADTQHAALALLDTHGDQAIQGLWLDFTDDYFLRHSAKEVAWHTHLLLNHNHEGKDKLETLVGVQTEPARGGNAIFLYTPLSKNIFAIVTGLLDELGLTILEAQINTTKSGASLDTFVVLEQNGKPVKGKSRIATVQKRLENAVNETHSTIRVTRRASRQLKAFSTPVQIHCTQHNNRNQTIVELTAPDYPGLLGSVGRAFNELGIDVHTAKITTVGEKAEDAFFVTNQQGQALDDRLVQKLRKVLSKALSNHVTA